MLLNRYDLEHRLLNGSVIFIGNIPTYKVTLNEMVEHGFSKMQYVISILSMDDDKAKELLNDSIEQPSTFLFVLASIVQEHQLLKNNQIKQNNIDDLLSNSIPLFLSLFFRKRVECNPSYGFIIGDTNEEKFILNETNYNEFRNILKERNCLMDFNDIDGFDNPCDEMTKKLLEKQKKLHEKIKKAKYTKGEGDDALTMADLISIFAEAEHMPLQDVYLNYDVYQFNNQFNRLRIMDDFHVNIQALLAGAKSDDVKLQHWLSKIKEQNG